jgi:xanthine/CO dehydrogenase XdhC/CoxF family maturation factor
VDIFVQPATVPEARRMALRVESLLAGDDPFTVSTIIGGEVGLGRTLVVDAHGELEGSTDDAALDRAIVARAKTILAGGTSVLYEIGAVQVFTEVQVPPPHMVIFGAGEDARPLARCSSDAGFRVAVIDHRPAYLATDWYPPGTRLIEARPGDRVGDLTFGPRTYTVVKTHMLANDRDWTAALLATEVPYIGVLGPRARIDEMLQQLGAEGDGRVFGPVGLDVGADGPDQIALSIVAEALSVYSHREPRHLRDREGVIHAG